MPLMKNKNGKATMLTNFGHTKLKKKGKVGASFKKELVFILL